MIQDKINYFVEAGASIEHARWSKWHKYMVSKCVKNKNGTLTLPKSFVDRWKRQADTMYHDLTDQEKESDKVEARSYIPILTKILG